MFKKLFIYVALLLSMTACSVEEIGLPSGMNPDGELSVTLAVPEMETVGTRADDQSVTKVTMVVLSNTGGGYTVSQIEPFSIAAENSLPNNRYKLSCQIDAALRSKSDLKFYFIANASTLAEKAITKGMTESSLIDLKLDSQLNGNYMLMSGACSLNDITGGNSVELNRNIVKVGVFNAVQDGDNYKAGTTAYPFQVYGTAEESSIISGALTDVTYLPAATANDAKEFAPVAEPLLHPTRNLGRDAKVRPYLIIKAPFNSTDYYYRVEFEKYDEATKKFTTLNLESNHYYQVLVTEVKGKGYSSAEEAALYPSTEHLIMTKINDFCPRAYNMITDGLRELGVTHELVHNGDPTTATTQKYIYVKLYSPDTADYASFKKENVTSEEPWLTFGTPRLQGEATDTGNAEGMDASFRGRVFQVPVNFIKTKDPGQVEGTIVVYWKGLTREIPVKWTREFDASDLCTVQFAIKDGNNSQKYPASGYADYWNFLKNDCKGVDSYSNNDSIRNEGLHFPMNYGGTTSTTRWKYEYIVEYQNLNDNNAYDWKVEVRNFPGLTITDANSNAAVSSGTTSGTVKLKITYDPSKTDIAGNPDSYWNYKVGTLRFKVATPGKQNWADYDIDLYHTGFFDNMAKFRSSAASHRLDATETDQFYYYEVRKGPEYETTDHKTAHYWILDRNLGASSARYYIEKEDGDPYYGDVNAAGGYYSAASYHMGSDPDVYTDLCPPGFEIPRTETWNAFRNSQDFSTRQSGTYYLAQFKNEDNQYINFPRARYFYNGRKMGESRAGYYWTGSGALGLEKEERGNWQRYLKFSGSITSYDNGEVNGFHGSLGYGMAVRCVNTTPKSTTTYRTSFNVAGATHVYLYSEVRDENGNVKRYPVTNWPGQNIGNFQTMKGRQLFNFVYDSPNTEAKDFYVLFTYRTEDGVWHTMSKGATGNSTKVTTNEPSSALTGWKVIGNTSQGEGWYNEAGNPVSTALGGYWYCSYTEGKVFYSASKLANPEYTIYYTNPNNWGTVYIHYWNADNNNAGTAWPGVQMTKEGNRWKYTIPSGVTHIIFHNNSGAQTGDIPVVEEDNHVYTNK